MAGLVDAVACIRVGRQTLIEVPHKSLSFLERLRDFLATDDKSHIVLRDFHRRNRLIVKSPLSEEILWKLLCRLRVRRVAVELILKPRHLISFKELRCFASLQQASLSQNGTGELRLVPLFQSPKRTLEFQNRAEEAKEMRRYLEMHLQRAKKKLRGKSFVSVEALLKAYGLLSCERRAKRAAPYEMMPWSIT